MESRTWLRAGLGAWYLMEVAAHTAVAAEGSTAPSAVAPTPTVTAPATTAPATGSPAATAPATTAPTATAPTATAPATTAPAATAPAAAPAAPDSAAAKSADPGAPSAPGTAPAASAASAPPSAPAAGTPKSVSPTVVTRQTFDAFGRLIHTITTTEDKVLSKAHMEYSASGQLLKKTTTAQGVVTVNSRTYEGGKLKQAETSVDGKVTSKEIYDYSDGQLARLTTVDAAGVAQTTSYTYDIYGNVLSEETRAANGTLLRYTSADIPRPIVPITVSFDLGGNYQSDVNAVDLVAGFAISRKPAVESFGADPLEVSVSGSYRRSQSKEIITNDQLLANFGVDYHNLLPRTTFFLFTNVERNPTANLDVDLVLAPVGAKFVFVEGEKGRFDASFAPVWNFRSVSDSVTGESTPTSYIRGSLRLRGGLTLGKVALSETLELLPNLTPDGLSFIDALEPQSILRTTTKLEIKLTSRISLKQELKVVRDLDLRSQAGEGQCAGDVVGTGIVGEDQTTLCAGYALTSLTTLGIKFDIQR